MDQIVTDTGTQPESQKLNQCLNFSMGNELSKVNGDNITSIVEEATTISDCSSNPSTASNTTKMVPVKLVTVTKGEGNVRLVRVSPVKSSPAATSNAPPVMSSNNHKADNGVNGNTAIAEVPSPQKNDTVEHIPSRKRQSQEFNSHECVSKKQSV